MDLSANQATPLTSLIRDAARPAYAPVFSLYDQKPPRGTRALSAPAGSLEQHREAAPRPSPVGRFARLPRIAAAARRKADARLLEGLLGLVRDTAAAQAAKQLEPA